MTSALNVLCNCTDVARDEDKMLAAAGAQALCVVPDLGQVQGGAGRSTTELPGTLGPWDPHRGPPVLIEAVQCGGRRGGVHGEQLSRRYMFCSALCRSALIVC